MILNLTQHKATAEQKAAGVEDVHDIDFKWVQKALTFKHLPDEEDINHCVVELLDIAAEYNIDTVMIGGAPWLMARLQKELQEQGHRVVYAFSQRESVETQNEDGEVVKTSVFKHIGFVQA